eukprot:scaffold1527_cov75-Skeletonema_dohrnii-CCMP3373.AAC.1
MPLVIEIFSALVLVTYCLCDVSMMIYDENDVLEMFVDCTSMLSARHRIEPTDQARHLVNTQDMTIGADAPAQKHICVRRLQDRVSVDVDRPDRVTDAHVVHIPQRRKNVWMDKN